MRTMTPRLIFRGLFSYGRGSLAWVRMYRAEARVPVALVIEPSDNPGPSAINDAEGLHDAVVAAFLETHDLRLFVRFPDDPRGTDWTEVLRADGEVDFRRREVAEIEALVGEPLPDPPEWTCAALGGAHHPLLGLIPAPEQEFDPLADLAVVAVADLPWAHNPSSCRWHERFETVRGSYPRTASYPAAVGAHWYLTLSQEDLDNCRYHQADWRRVADVSVEVLEGLEAGTTVDDALDAVHGILGESAETPWCTSLFVDPITFERGADSVGDGQHRSCALRVSGADLCVADIGGDTRYTPRPSSPKRQAAAEVARFWTTLAAD